MLDLVSRTAARVFAPLTVGGGVRSEADFVALLRAGADKVSVNSSAVKEPGLVDRLSAIAGAQALVVAVDVKRRAGAGGPDHRVGGLRGRRLAGPPGARGWPGCREVADRGAGELLLTSMDRDGTQAGYDLELLERVAAAVTHPGHRLGRGGHAGAPGRGAALRRRGAGRVDLPRRQPHGGRGQDSTCWSAGVEVRP